MSRRRKNQDATDAALGVASSVVKNASPLTLLIGAIVIIVVLLAVGAYFLVSQPKATPTPVPVPASAGQVDDESGAQQVGRSDITPVPGVSANLGSGGSASSDWYELHFTNPTYPDKKETHKGGLDSYLVSLMGKAQKTLDVADYDFDLVDVTDAMVAAKGRGVQVRMVTDSDTINNKKNQEIQAAFAKLEKAGITVVPDNRGPIMHNKFTVVDKEWIQTGSWNYTDGDTYRLNNNMIIIHNPQLAENYTVEFEKMFVKKQFGPNKDKGVPHPSLTIGTAKLQNYFAAEDGVESHIVETISTARQSVYFMAFSFTADKIGDAIIEKSKAGLKTGGVFETTGSNTPYSEYGRMKKAGLDVYTDGNPYVMHHKVIIIDDHITIFGSFNFSDNADTANDENILIVDDAGIAKAFKAEYDRVLELAKNPPVKKK